MDNKLINKITNELNLCLKQNKYQILKYKYKFKITDLTNTKNIVTDQVDRNNLSRLFFKNYIPQSRNKVYFHYTTIKSLKSIIKTECIRLSSVHKRFGEQEFKPFYKTHHMDGYANKMTKKGVPLETIICKNSFYLSLVGKNIGTDTENHLAFSFAENNKGVKLVFRVSNLKTDLRKVYYPKNEKDKSIPLLKDFADITKKHGMYLIFQGLAKFGFFYLPQLFAIENEHRLLITRTMAAEYNLTISKNRKQKYEYLKLPLFDNQILNIVLEKIIILDKNKEEKVRKIIASNPKFSSVILET